MDFVKDGGLSCVRYSLSDKDHSLSNYALDALTTPGRISGRLYCVCGAIDMWNIVNKSTHVMLYCGCNGSGLPLYIGRPPDVLVANKTKVRKMVEAVFAYRPKIIECRFEKHPCDAAKAIEIGIGCPSQVPTLGTLDVERAQEVVVVSKCMHCMTAYLAWTYRLEEPYKISGNESWLKTIQALNK